MSKLTLGVMTSDPGAANAGYKALYVKSDGLYTEDESGTVVKIGPGGGGGTPAGSNTQVQYNNSGSFGACSKFTYDGTCLTVWQAGADPDYDCRIERDGTLDHFKRPNPNSYVGDWGFHDGEFPWFGWDDVCRGSKLCFDLSDGKAGIQTGCGPLKISNCNCNSYWTVALS